MTRGLRLASLIVTAMLLAATGVYFLTPERAQSQHDTTAERTERVTRDREQVRLSFAPAVKKANPAVVNIYVRQRQRERRSPLLEDPFFRRFFGREFGIPRRRAQQSLGSGVIVSADGLVVTNYHVIRGRRRSPKRGYRDQGRAVGRA